MISTFMQGMLTVRALTAATSTAVIGQQPQDMRHSGVAHGPWPGVVITHAPCLLLFEVGNLSCCHQDKL